MCFDGLVKSALSTQPYAAIAWSGATIIISLVQESMSQCETMIAGVNDIATKQTYWRVCHQVFLSETTDEVRREIELQLIELFASMLEYEFLAISHLSKRAHIRGASDILGRHDWIELRQSITALHDQAKDLVPSVHETIVQKRCQEKLDQVHKSNQILEEIHQMLYTFLQNRKNEAGNDLLRSLSKQPYSTSLPDIETKVHGTFEWFYEGTVFKKWLQSNESGIFWISAGPGCGKSVLAKSLLGDGLLRTGHSKVNIAHFFFKEGDANRDSICSALCRIIHQILEQDPTRTLLQNVLERQYTADDSLASSFEKLWALFQDIVSCSYSGNTFLVLDALDECSRLDWSQFMNAAQKFFAETNGKDSSNILKILITSRPYHDFKLGRSDNPLSKHITLFKFPEVSKDIDLFIEARVDRIAAHLSSAQRKAISDRLRENKDRTFLWLALTFKYIENNPGLFPREADIEDQLNRLPNDLFDTYGSLLSKVQDQKRSQTLLEIVYSAGRALTLMEANYALTLALAPRQPDSHKALERDLFPENTFAEYVRNYSGFMVDVFDNELSFIHTTAREFLAKTLDQGDIENHKKSPARTHWQGIFNSQHVCEVLPSITTSFLNLQDFVSEKPVNRFPSELADLLGRRYPLLPLSVEFHKRSLRGTQEEETMSLLLGDRTNEKPTLHLVANFLTDPIYREGMTEDACCLFLAWCLGFHAMVDDLLRNSTTINVNLGLVASLFTPLFFAIGFDNVTTARSLLVDPRVEYESESLFLSRGKQGESKIEMLKDVVGRPGVLERFEPWEDDRAGTPRARDRHLAVLQIELSRGEESDLSAIKKLLDVIDPSTYSLTTGRNYLNLPPLHLACASGRKDLVKLLLGTPGIDLNNTDVHGRTALDNMCEDFDGERVEIVELLLGTQGIDANHRGWNGRTAFMRACRGLRTQLVKVLLNAEGVDIGAVDDSGLSALCHAILQYAHAREPISIIGMICAAEGIDMNTTLSSGQTVHSTLEEIKAGIWRKPGAQAWGLSKVKAFRQEVEQAQRLEAAK